MTSIYNDINNFNTLCVNLTRGLNRIEHSFLFKWLVILLMDEVDFHCLSL